jgi:hypothetical protein
MRPCANRLELRAPRAEAPAKLVAAMEIRELRAEREMRAASHGELVPDPIPLRPARRQIYAIARLLLEREGIEWPRSRADASELIARLRRQGARR